MIKAQLREAGKKSKTSIAISVAIHVAAAAALMSITFHYPIDELFQRPEPIKAIPVRFIKLKPSAEKSAAPRQRVAARPVSPPAAAAPLAPQPTNVPAGIPAPVTPPAPTGVALGAGGTGVAASNDPGMGFGIRPGVPDGRLITNPMAIARAPETEGQKAERALSAIYTQYLDSARAAMANPKRAPGDWSWGGADGDKWGWDQNGIHLGGITIPNVVLAALPLGAGPSGRNMNAITEMRTESYVRSDIQYHAGLMTEDEFRAAVRRVRDRVDRERRERMEKEKERAAKTPPCCS